LRNTLLRKTSMAGSVATLWSLVPSAARTDRPPRAGVRRGAEAPSSSIPQDFVDPAEIAEILKGPSVRGADEHAAADWRGFGLEAS